MIFFIKESKKIERSKFELKRRRFNWKTVTIHQVKNYFEYICNKSKEDGYPFTMTSLVADETYDKGQRNGETVQLQATTNHTGVVEFINNSEVKGCKAILEKGATLVVSFTITGTVVITMYPYASDLHHKKEENIIIYADISPDEVTRELLEKCVKIFLMYIRDSSVFCVYGNSFLDRVRIDMMIFRDIRRGKIKEYRSRFFNFINQAAVAIIGAIIGTVIGGLVLYTIFNI